MLSSSATKQSTSEQKDHSANESPVPFRLDDFFDFLRFAQEIQAEHPLLVPLIEHFTAIWGRWSLVRKLFKNDSKFICSNLLSLNHLTQSVLQIDAAISLNGSNNPTQEFRQIMQQYEELTESIKSFCVSPELRHEDFQKVLGSFDQFRQALDAHTTRIRATLEELKGDIADRAERLHRELLNNVKSNMSSLFLKPDSCLSDTASKTDLPFSPTCPTASERQIAMQEIVKYIKENKSRLQELCRNKKNFKHLFDANGFITQVCALDFESWYAIFCKALAIFVSDNLKDPATIVDHNVLLRDDNQRQFFFQSYRGFSVVLIKQFNNVEAKEKAEHSKEFKPLLDAAIDRSDDVFIDTHSADICKLSPEALSSTINKILEQGKYKLLLHLFETNVSILRREFQNVTFLNYTDAQALDWNDPVQRVQAVILLRSFYGPSVTTMQPRVEDQFMVKSTTNPRGATEETIKRTREFIKGLAFYACEKDLQKCVNRLLNTCWPNGLSMLPEEKEPHTREAVIEGIIEICFAAVQDPKRDHYREFEARIFPVFHIEDLMRNLLNAIKQQDESLIAYFASFCKTFAKSHRNRFPPSYANLLRKPEKPLAAVSVDPDKECGKRWFPNQPIFHVDDRNQQGLTLLHVAAGKGLENMVTYLITEKADPAIKAKCEGDPMFSPVNDGETPAQYMARTQSNRQIVSKIQHVLSRRKEEMGASSTEQKALDTFLKPAAQRPISLMFPATLTQDEEKCFAQMLILLDKKNIDESYEKFKTLSPEKINPRIFEQVFDHIVAKKNQGRDNRYKNYQTICQKYKAENPGFVFPKKHDAFFVAENTQVRRKSVS